MRDETVNRYNQYDWPASRVCDLRDISERAYPGVGLWSGEVADLRTRLSITPASSHFSFLSYE